MIFPAFNPKKARRLERFLPGRFFTLVELLVVVAIMGIIIAVGLPAFEKLTIGSGVDAVSRTVGAQLRLARQYAISNRCYVAVLFPSTQIADHIDQHYLGGGWTEPQKNKIDPLLFSTVRACLIQKPITPATKLVFSDWIPNTKWELLPIGGLVFQTQDNAVANNRVFATATPAADRPTGNGSITAAMMTWVDGVPLPVDNDNDGKIGEDASEKYNDIRAIVFKPNGGMYGGGQRNVVIGEGVFANHDILYRKGSNWLQININPYTGRVKFIPR
jgi:prepilin-type N-terminal cleavage/methylation domain-containing protein